MLLRYIRYIICDEIIYQFNIFIVENPDHKGINNKLINAVITHTSNPPTINQYATII